MNDLTKKIVLIVTLVLIIGIISVMPGFAETQEELRQIFVTRDEVKLWINGSGASTGISEVLASLEVNMQEQVQSKVKEEMSKRGIKDKTETTVAAEGS